jgi:thermitase
VLDNSGNGTYANISNGIRWAADSGAKVINMSLGGSFASSTLESAVNYAASKGVVVVAAAGNAGNTKQQYPAFYTNCVAVAATDQSDRRARFSTYGSWVDCAAPGVGIASCYPTNSYVYMDGTSMAAPHVSALAALVWDTPFGTSATAVRNRVQSTGDLVTNNFHSYPTRRINAARAVGAIP